MTEPTLLVVHSQILIPIKPPHLLNLRASLISGECTAKYFLARPRPLFPCRKRFKRNAPLEQFIKCGTVKDALLRTLNRQASSFNGQSVNGKEKK